MVHANSRSGYGPRMPFGKYKGRLVEDLPDDYLHWLATIERDGRLQDAVAAEVACRRHVRHQRRAANDSTGPINTQPNRLPANMPEIVTRWYREMSLLFHPDRGGSVEAMAAINVAADRLAKLLEVA